MPDKIWVDPKSDYIASDQVTPTVFNTLGENEKYLYEIRCSIEKKTSAGVVTTINNIVFVEE